MRFSTASCVEKKNFSLLFLKKRAAGCYFCSVVMWRKGLRALAATSGLNLSFKNRKDCVQTWDNPHVLMN